ncbi:MAG TPA: glucose 1-dehydrogenase [Capillimicrobium sp.]|nr:glucose 1-dehydrogenase [Capillimicrobium sp.]
MSGDERLDGKVAVITGGARGMGAVEAELFASRGAQVVLTDVMEEEGQAVADRIGDAATFVRQDVGSEADWAAVMALVRERHGRLDILVNNAGVYRRASIEETTPEVYDFHYRVNQLGPFLGMRAALEPMRANGGGAIVNVSSISGIRAFPDQAAYASTKWAVRGMTKNAAVELAAFGIRVNSLHPGFTDTEMIQENTPELNQAAVDGAPMRRAGRREELARAALFLASDASSFLTGAELVVDGGLTL